jgi:Rrf2 family transcriptional regulator, nitric oxide-sensitive transcriptional repressor
MQLKMFTDHAVRTLVFVAQQTNRRVTLDTIATALGASRNHLMKVTLYLVAEGYIDTIRGQRGGLSLKVPASEIKLGQLVHRAERNHGLLEDASSSASAYSRSLARAYEAFMESLNTITIADLASETEIALIKPIDDLQVGSSEMIRLTDKTSIQAEAF